MPRALFVLLAAASVLAAVVLWEPESAAQTIPEVGQLLQNYETKAALMTQGPTTVTVDLSGQGNFSSIQSALDAYPTMLTYRQRLNLDAGTYSGGFGKVLNHFCGWGDGITMGGIDVVGSYQPAVLDAGISSGTSLAMTGTTANNATWAHVDVADAGWIPHFLADAGYWFQAQVNGADVQEALSIHDNGANSLELVGQWATAPSATVDFVIREPTTIISGVMPSASCPVSPAPGVKSATSTARACAIVAMGNKCEASGARAADPLLTFQYVKFQNDGSSTAQALAVHDEGSPIAMRNVWVSNWGTGTRLFVPMGDRESVFVSRSHLATTGRLASFNPNAPWQQFWFDRNEVQGVGTISLYDGSGFASVNNLYRGTVSFGSQHCYDCSWAGDKFQGTFTATLSGAFQAPATLHSGRTLASLDAVTAAAFGPVFFGAGEVRVDHGSSNIGPVGASTFVVPASTVAVDLQPGGRFLWKHGTTVWTMTATEAAHSIKTNHNLDTGTKMSDLDSSVRGWIEGPYGSFAGWSEDTTDPTSGNQLPVYGSCEAGGVMDPNSHGECSIRHFAAQATANGSGVATLTFGAPLCQIAPVCQCNDTNASAVVQIPSSTTATCVCTALGGAAGAGHVINITGDCNTIK